MSLTIPANDDGTPFILKLSVDEMMDIEKVEKFCNLLRSMSEQLISESLISAAVASDKESVLFTIKKDQV